MKTDINNATISIRLMQDNSEIIPYDTPGFPIYIRSGWLSMYTNMRSLCHWHEDIEFIRIHNGSMCYWINGKTILLKEGDCLFVNTRQMHYGYSWQDKDCDFTCIILHPTLLSMNQMIRTEFVNPLLNNSALEYLHFRAECETAESIRNCLDRILSLKKERLPAYELQIAGVMCLLFGELYRMLWENLKSGTPKDHPDIAIRQNMIFYIYEHYPEKIGLSDISRAGNVCRNKCCQIFSKYIHQSPIDFLNRYRLEVSRNLLGSKDLSIIQIAQACGFNHSSYYSKLFYRTYHCTPTEYRKNGREMGKVE
ncbi:MAG: AraC family transcriptional regulator [Eubacteriales bacterium]|nr:AraC family transcriptional regulator [Eubacteriales bacterium]